MIQTIRYPPSATHSIVSAYNGELNGFNISPRHNFPTSKTREFVNVNNLDSNVNQKRNVNKIWETNDSVYVTPSDNMLGLTNLKAHTIFSDKPCSNNIFLPNVAVMNELTQHDSLNSNGAESKIDCEFCNDSYKNSGKQTFMFKSTCIFYNVKITSCISLCINL